MHNNIMAAGSKDRPPMLGPGRYSQQLQPEWSRFVTVVKQREEIDTLSYHRLFDILKQFQNEVNDIRSERLARSANPLALLAAAQPYSDNYLKAQDLNESNAHHTCNLHHTTKCDYQDTKAKRDRQTNYSQLSPFLRKTTIETSARSEDTTPRYNNDNQSGQFGNQRTMTVAGDRETEGQRWLKDSRIKGEDEMCKQLNKVFHSSEQADWLEYTDERLIEQRFGSTLQLHGKEDFSEVHMKNPVLLVSHWNR
ncbi:hypothetical protein Tco_0515456 [Tanacetum coccineum]